MGLGIRPIVDFAFKKTFGDPGNRVALISLLNAILQLPEPIVDVLIENPFQYQDFLEDKLSVLDIKAKDHLGSIFHIEMQLSVKSGLEKRLVFYGCELFAGQLSQGDDYSRLRPVYSICIVDAVIFGTGLSGHHRFRLTDHETGLTLENSLEIHLLELPRYTFNELQLADASPVARWSYWLSHAHEYDAETLRQLFPEEGFRRAITTIETIAFKTEDKQMYDTREKAARDQQWLINGARMDGREEGRVEGLREGVELGQLVGIVRNCQSLLGLPETSTAELMRLSFDELSELAQLFKQKVRSKA